MVTQLDERNEYHGITLERANRVLEALGVRVRCSFDLPGTMQTIRREDWNTLLRFLPAGSSA